MLSSLDSDFECPRTLFRIATMFAALVHADLSNTPDYGRLDYTCFHNSFDLSILFECNILGVRLRRMYLSLPFAHWMQHSRILVYIATKLHKIIWLKFNDHTISIITTYIHIIHSATIERPKITNDLIGLCQFLLFFFKWRAIERLLLPKLKEKSTSKLLNSIIISRCHVSNFYCLIHNSLCFEATLRLQTHNWPHWS